MTGVITFENLTFIVAILGVIFGVYHFFRNPDIKNDKAICLLENELKSSKEISTIAIKTMQNDVHTLNSKIDSLSLEVKQLCIMVGKLETIINERLPRK